ncbi:sensor histidine kinase [Kitasatospora sp. NPDC048239]|uniref:sensor histidine kinase n=1 Tax=Kitasatospora sp. NPDC048239 TaxID=3364046 RepID=UPI0037237F91
MRTDARPPGPIPADPPLRPLHRLWHRPSVRLRAALGAALASLAAFAVATAWIGDEVRGQWTELARKRAESSVVMVTHDIPTGTQSWGENMQESFLLVLADGRLASPLRPPDEGRVFFPNERWVRASTLLDEYTGSPAAPFTDLSPFAQDVGLGHTERVRVRLPDRTALPHLEENGPTLAGRTVTLIKRVTDPVSSQALEQYTGIAGLPEQRVTVYLLVNPTTADQAADRITGIFARYVVPGATLFTALVAWLVTGLALRPVETIRRRMARIGAGAFHERVPVPPSGDEISRLATTTNTTLGQLEHALREQRRLVCDASHELRSPIAALRSSLEVTLAHPADADWPRVVRSALADTERLQLLTDDLLLLAATDEATTNETAGEAADEAAGDGRRARPATRLTDLADLAAEQLAERAHLAPDGPRCTAATLQPALIAADELLLARLLRNLLDNAVAHARAEVVVSLTADGGSAVLTVTDDGPGIPAADRERVFDRFVRLDEARDRAAGGAGLGLSLVRSIAHRLGGSAVLTDPPAPLTGAHAVIRLPLRPEPTEAESKAAAEQATAAAERP